MKDTGKTIYQKEKVEKLIKKEHFTEVNYHIEFSQRLNWTGNYPHENDLLI